MSPPPDTCQGHDDRPKRWVLVWIGQEVQELSPEPGVRAAADAWTAETHAREGGAGCEQRVEVPVFDPAGVAYVVDRRQTVSEVRRHGRLAQAWAHGPPLTVVDILGGAPVGSQGKRHAKRELVFGTDGTFTVVQRDHGEGSSEQLANGQWRVEAGILLLHAVRCLDTRTQVADEFQFSIDGTWLYFQLRDTEGALWNLRLVPVR